MYSCTISLPSSLKNKINEQQLNLAFEAKTVGDALKSLTQRYEEINSFIFDANGQIQKFVNIYLGEDNIKDCNYLDTDIYKNANIVILSAVAGG